MNQKKPKNHTVVDMYKLWCKEALAEHQDYFGAYDHKIKTGIQIIYKRFKSSFVEKEAIEGVIDGINKVFYTKAVRAYQHSSKRPKTIIYKNGIKQKGACKHKDYAICGNKITMTDAPKKGDVIEATYSIENNIVVMSYTMFRLIIETYNKYAAEAIIQGESVTLGNNLGYIYPARIERNYNRLKCDVVATIKIRKTDPTHPAIYFTEDDFCMIKWKKFSKLQNEIVYMFKPCNSLASGFYQQIKLNPILKTLYRYIPYKDYSQYNKEQNNDSKLD